MTNPTSPPQEPISLPEQVDTITKPRAEFLEKAERCGARITGKPDGSEPIEIVFTVAAWRAFDGACAELDRAHRAASPDVAKMAQRLTDEQVEWVVNDNAELGVKIGNQFFFLYKGYSLVYGSDVTLNRKDGIAVHDDDTPMHWRPVFKREFGECCHPINYEDPTYIGMVSLDDSDEWKPLPAATQARAEPTWTAEQIAEVEQRGAELRARFKEPTLATHARAAVGAVQSALPAFEDEWAKYEAKGFRYGREALENVRFGYKIAVEAALSAQTPVVGAEQGAGWRFTADTIMQRVGSGWPDFMAPQCLFKEGEVLSAQTPGEGWTAVRIVRLKDAIEGELDGLCITDDVASEIIAYLDTGLPPDLRPKPPATPGEPLPRSFTSGVYPPMDGEQA